MWPPLQALPGVVASELRSELWLRRCAPAPAGSSVLAGVEAAGAAWVGLQVVPAQAKATEHQVTVRQCVHGVRTCNAPEAWKENAPRFADAPSDVQDWQAWVAGHLPAGRHHAAYWISRRPPMPANARSATFAALAAAAAEVLPLPRTLWAAQNLDACGRVSVLVIRSEPFHDHFKYHLLQWGHALWLVTSRSPQVQTTWLAGAAVPYLHAAVRVLPALQRLWVLVWPGVWAWLFRESE